MLQQPTYHLHLCAMFPQRTSQSAEMLWRILVESSIKHEDARDHTEQQAVVENVDGPIDEASAAGQSEMGCITTSRFLVFSRKLYRFLFL